MKAVIVFCLLQNAESAYSSSARPYQVNIIIFARNDINWLQPEHNKKPFNLQQFSKAQLLLPTQPDMVNQPPYTVEQGDSFALKEQYQALMQSADYHVLQAFSWWQPFGYSEDLKIIRLSGGALYDQYGNAVSADFIDWARAFTPDQVHWQIDGTIAFSLDKYLNANVNLQYLSPDRKNGEMIPINKQLIHFTPLKVYSIKQSVRTRSGALNYLDNAAFGMIIDFEHYTPLTLNTEEKINLN